LTELSIIIVNYKTPRLVLDCLQTIYRETSNTSFETILVDNNSCDNSREIIEAQYPSVRWVQMSYNSGFARANNEGIRQARGGIVLLLNSDTLVEDKAIEGCFEQFSRSDYIACGVQLVNPDHSPQISGNFFMKGGLNYLLPLPYLGTLMKTMGDLFSVPKPNVPDSDSLVEVDWINGAYLMVKKEAAERAGPLDEDFFLYAEEAEWCGRLRKWGKLCVYGQFKVIHLQGASANETFGSAGKGYYNFYDRKGLQIMLSNFLRIRKQFGIFWFLVQLFFYILEIPIFLAGVLISSLVKRRLPRYSFAQWLKYCKNIGFVIGKSFRIIRNKPYFYKVL
jgi:GT2 family glycosyltransferase